MKLFKTLACLIALCLPAFANSSGALNVTQTVATLRGIPAAAGLQLNNIQVQDYYGTGTGCPIQYAWNSSDTRSDDGGGVINPTGNVSAGRWNLSVPANSPIHSCWYGVKVDTSSSFSAGTDNTTQMQRMLNFAYLYGPNYVHLDGKPNECIGVSTTLTVGQGTVIEGDTRVDFNNINSSGTSFTSGSCIVYLGATGGVVLMTNSIQTGFGTVPFEAPKFRDFSIAIPSTDTSAGGCIQLNSISGGFTDSSVSQQYMENIDFENMYCYMRLPANTPKIGFQISKAFDGSFTNVKTSGGATGFDIEGSDNITLRSIRTDLTYGPNVIFQAHGTFGNVDVLENSQLLGTNNAGQSVDSLIFDAALESSIQNVFFENANGNTLTSEIHLKNGNLASINGNAMTAITTNWLVVDGIFSNINATGNSNSGLGLSGAKFNNGNILVNNSAGSVLSHFGNGSGADNGWPFNNGQQAFDQALTPNTQAVISPDYFFPSALGYGLSEIPVNSFWRFDSTGSGNYLDFPTVPRSPTLTGTFNASLYGWQDSGSGAVTCQLEDGGSLVGSPIAATLSTTGSWHTMAFSQAISTGLGARCWDTGGSSSGNKSHFILVITN